MPGNFTEVTAAEINHNLVCTFIEVSAVYRFCYKPNLTVLKSCMMLSRSSIMVLCFGRDLFPRVSLHEDLHTNSTHCMQIILKTRFQFPRWVMKNFLFLKVITIFKLIYLLWLKMKQTLSGFCVTHFTSEARTQPVSRDLCYSLRQSFNASYWRGNNQGKTRVNPEIYKEERLK